MNNSKRRELFEAALKPKTSLNPNVKEEMKQGEVNVFQQQIPHTMNDLPEVREFVHVEDL